MKKVLVTLVLIISLVATSASSAFASSRGSLNLEERQYEKIGKLLKQEAQVGGVIDNALETSKNLIYKTNDVEMIVPKNGSEVIETNFDGGENTIGMNLPKEVFSSKGKKLNNGTMIYNSASENIDVLVQMLEDEENGFVFSSLRTMILIKEANAPQEYDFQFDLPEGGRLITSEEYKRLCQTENSEWIGDNLVFIVDKDFNIISTIDEAWAKDANGKNVETYYEINGNVLTQYVDFDSSSAFPILADPTTTGVQTKVETLSFTNTSSNVSKLIQARREVNERQNSTLTKVISLINSVFGLFNIATGIMSMTISGVMNGNAAFLEKCEDTYSGILEKFQQNKISSAEIYFTYRGTYQGKNKGYVYSIQDVTNNCGV